MSANANQNSTLLNANDVAQIANLSRLALDENKAHEYADSLNKILGLMHTLQAIDTTGVEPLKSPFEHAQPLRTDAVTQSNQRENYQAVAPATQDGLYLVPRVIE